MARPRGAKARADGRASSGSRRSIPTPSARSCTTNAFQLLAATILSAQTTDENVNKVTPALFAEYPTPRDLAHADPDDVERIVHSDRVLPLEDEEPDRDGAHARRATSTARCRPSSTTS